MPMALLPLLTKCKPNVNICHYDKKSCMTIYYDVIITDKVNTLVELLM